MPLEIITAGEFPAPAQGAVEIDGVKTVNLETLVELKLASGLSGLNRLRDLAGVQDLIRILDLNAEFAEKLDDSVRALYLELWDELQRAREQTKAPDAEVELADDAHLG